jgi:thiaminase
LQIQLVQHIPGKLISTLEEKLQLTGFVRYVLDVGQSEDWLALQIALAPCLIGYGEIAKRLHADPQTKRDGNIYWKWIETYVAEDYSEAVRTGSCESPRIHLPFEAEVKKALIERHAILQSPSRIEELVKIFIHATRYVIATDMCGNYGGHTSNANG